MTGDGDRGGRRRCAMRSPPRRSHHHRLAPRRPRSSRCAPARSTRGPRPIPVPGHRRRRCRRGGHPRRPGARIAGRAGGVGGSGRPGAARAPCRHVHPGRSARRHARIHRRPRRVHRQPRDRERRAPGARHRGGARARPALARRAGRTAERLRLPPGAPASAARERSRIRTPGAVRRRASSPPSAARISMPAPRHFWRGCRSSTRS